MKLVIWKVSLLNSLCKNTPHRLEGDTISPKRMHLISTLVYVVAAAVSWRYDHARFAYLRELKQLSVSAFPLEAASLFGNPRAFRPLRYYFAIIPRRYSVWNAQPVSRKSAVARTTPTSEMLGKWRNVLPNSERVTCSRLPEMNAKQRGSSYQPRYSSYSFLN